MTPPRRTWRGLPLGVRLAVLACVALVLLGGLELAARRAGIPELPTWQRVERQGALMVGHPSRLWGMSPGEQPNAGSTATINARGLRGPLPELPRPAGRQRILLLGDSSFFGHGVSDDATLTARLQARLQARGLDVDTVNAAVAGYSVAQSALLMAEEGWDMQPTLLLLANLWSDNTWDAFEDEDLLRSRRMARLNPLVHSAALRLLLSRLPLQGGRIIVFRPERSWPEAHVRRVPLPRFSALTDGLIREAAARGIGAVLLQPTNTTLLQPPDPRATHGWAPYFQVFAALAACHSVPRVDLTAPFLARAAQGATAADLFLDRMHPTPLGQDLMAEAIAAALLDAGWPDTPLTGSAAPCDTSSIQDSPPPAWFSGEGGQSPQSNLFPEPIPGPPEPPPPTPRSVGHF